ncbi:spore germination protein KB [Gracilibacillus orientalis]|uniref:Spore germination protein KB n=1 Tax=Gracilibacillus orientalis TaxID=334253 RepID=A0A1I4PP38_9BACI|nr:endospore germination permease [Gracilibacillus orientalis]SFM29444.1 spore germination protein KB [Gracilibacillus orientalis]
MIEKGKISALQMGIMMYHAIIATGILFIPSTVYEAAKQDIWISPIWACPLGLLSVYIAYKLHKLYPNHTIIQYSEHILGTFLGKVLGLVLLLLLYTSVSVMIWQYGEFVVSEFLPHTPKFVIIGMMVLLCAFAVHGGLEVIGRLAEMVVPVFFLLFLIIIILLLPDIEIKRMLPVMENGMMPSVKGSVALYTWFAQFGIIYFFLPFLTNREKGMKSGMFSVLVVTLTLMFTNIIVILVFGSVTENFNAPLMSATRYISIAEFLSHLEALVMAIWLAGTFIKICVFYYAVVLGTAQWLNLSNYRSLVLPVGFLIGVFAMQAFLNSAEAAEHFRLVSQGLMDTLVYGTMIPMFLFFVAYIRKLRIFKQRGERER